MGGAAEAKTGLWPAIRESNNSCRPEWPTAAGTDGTGAAATARMLWAAGVPDGARAVRAVRMGRDERDGTGRDGTGRDGTGRDGTGRDGTGRDGTGRDGTDLADVMGWQHKVFTVARSRWLHWRQAKC